MKTVHGKVYKVKFSTETNEETRNFAVNCCEYFLDFKEMLEHIKEVVNNIADSYLWSNNENSGIEEHSDYFDTVDTKFTKRELNNHHKKLILSFDGEAFYYNIYASIWCKEMDLTIPEEES